MPTLEQVWQQIHALPDRYVFYTRKEIRYLPKILSEGERIHALTSGFLNNRTWLCVCTNRRLLFLDRGMFWGLRQIQMNLDRIQAIEARYSLFFGSIRVWDGASAFEVGLIPKPSIAPFVRTVQTAMDYYKRQLVHDIVGSAARVTAANTASVAPPTAHAVPTHSLASELERLSQLKTAGQLSDAEFAAAKAKLLSEK